ncbi:efflux RND transporter periplasmic adaptor subunit [Acidicapsa ligni]|uniref:efflux RND transporter periplasmic adaptor subunit n=1 Tax=Acidicapsa ligni TaxID=542300 RepID=UPI0021DFFBAF|nr:efflux RND transporter periplasmic adaptor subunit [Acidicapsa ligni]
MRNRRVLAFVSVAVVAIALLALVLHRHKKEPAAAERGSTIPVVPYVPAQKGTISQGLTVAGIFQPFQEIDVHGKVSGYIRHIYVDIGDKVHQGQTLAVLEVPELQAEVAGADAGVNQSQQDIARLKSEIAREQASYQAAHANYTRLKQASDQQPGLVAAQELDDALARDRSAESQVEAAKSAVAAAEGKLDVSRADRLRVTSMAQYATITAPFSGVVTMRYADTGALIPAGTSESNAQAVVRLAQSDLLRLRMPIPEQDVPLVAEGSTVMVHVQATGQQFPAKVVRFTRDVSNATRTMLCEVDVPNPKLTLTPGMYANISFLLRQQQGSLVIPTVAVIQGDEPAVFLVDSNNRLERRPVVLGITSANSQEITGGLQIGDHVAVGDLGTLQPREQVQPQLASQDLLSYHASSKAKSKGDQ